MIGQISEIFDGAARPTRCRRPSLERRGSAESGRNYNLMVSSGEVCVPILPTTTTVASSANTSVFGQTVTFTATVSPNPGAAEPV
jgi:hypothetical protein